MSAKNKVSVFFYKEIGIGFAFTVNCLNKKKPHLGLLILSEEYHLISLNSGRPWNILVFCASINVARAIFPSRMLIRIWQATIGFGFAKAV